MPSLWTTLSKQIQSLFAAVQRLSQALIARDEENDQVSKLTGMVWSQCTRITQFKMSNKALARLEIKKQLAPMRDALKELKQCKEAADKGAIGAHLSCSSSHAV